MRKILLVNMNQNLHWRDLFMQGSKDPAVLLLPDQVVSRKMSSLRVLTPQVIKSWTLRQGFGDQLKLKTHMLRVLMDMHMNMNMLTDTDMMNMHMTMNMEQMAT